jgi:hypothetical protein
VLPVTAQQHPRQPAVPRRYREIRSARFPEGLPDRCDTTVIEAFADTWLLVDHGPGGAELVGMAEDYEAARAWLTGPEDPARA